MTLERGVRRAGRTSALVALNTNTARQLAGFSERRDHEVGCEFRQLPGTTRQRHRAGLCRAIEYHMAEAGVAVWSSETTSVSSPSAGFEPSRRRLSSRSGSHRSSRTRLCRRSQPRLCTPNIPLSHAVFRSAGRSCSCWESSCGRGRFAYGNRVTTALRRLRQPPPLGPASGNVPGREPNASERAPSATGPPQRGASLKRD